MLKLLRSDFHEVYVRTYCGSFWGRCIEYDIKGFNEGLWALVFCDDNHSYYIEDHNILKWRGADKIENPFPKYYSQTKMNL
jgi:hypothetical protein